MDQMDIDGLLLCNVRLCEVMLDSITTVIHKCQQKKGEAGCVADVLLFSKIFTKIFYFLSNRRFGVEVVVKLSPAVVDD